MCSERGLCVGLCFGWFGRVRAGLAPRAPLAFGRWAAVRPWVVRFVLRMPVCVWCRNGGCRPAPQLQPVKGCPPVLRGMVEVCHLGGAELVVDKQHGARREQVSAPPDLLASLLFLLSLPASQHLPGSGVRAAPPCVLCLCSVGWGCGLCFTHGCHRWHLIKGEDSACAFLRLCPFGVSFPRGYLCECAVGAWCGVGWWVARASCFSPLGVLLGCWCAYGSGHCRHGTGVVSWGFSRMMGGRVGGLAPEHLFEVMKLTIWCVVGMITPICEGWGWFGSGRLPSGATARSPIRTLWGWWAYFISPVLQR